MIARTLTAHRNGGPFEVPAPLPGELIGFAPTAHRLPGQTWPQTAALSRQVITGALEHPVLRGLLPVSAGFAQSTAGPDKPLTGIDPALFLYCTRGRGWCDLEGRRHEIRPGDFAVIPPGGQHSFGANPGQSWAVSWVQALGANLGNFLAELGTTTQGPVVPLGEDARLLALFQEVVQALGGCTHARLVYAAQALAHLLGAAIWRRCDAARGEPDVGRKIEQSIAYMQQHLDQPMQVARLAALTNLSPSYYARLFKDRTGCAPIDYFIRLRMEHAGHLLAGTCLSVKEVAAALGYADQFYFSRVFKAVNRVSPSEYRVPAK
jgi:AraC family transcriptional regulator of arabinose operon